MAVQRGSNGIGAIQVGSTRIGRVFAGSRLLWQAMSWDFIDDFERPDGAPGSDWVNTGGWITDGALMKNGNAGSGDVWTAQTFGSDNLEVQAMLGPIGDDAQVAAIILGNPSQHVYVEFSRERLRGLTYDGRVWTTIWNGPAQDLQEGDIVRFQRTGDTFEFSRNGSVLGSFTSSLAKGPSYRRVNLNVHMARNFFINWYGPSFDEVRIAAR